MELTLYQKILESNLVNFILMVSILTLIFKKARLGTFIDKMALDIKTSVISSSEAAQSALKEYKEAKRSTKDAENIKKGIIENANQSAKNMEETSLNLLKQEEETIEAKCQIKIENDIQKAKEKTAVKIFENVINLAQNEIQTRLDDKMQIKIIKNCINEIDTLEETGL